MKATVAARRAELVERIAEVDETVGELFLMEEPIDDDTLKAGIRRATVNLKFVPVFMGRFVLVQQSVLSFYVLYSATSCALYKG